MIVDEVMSKKPVTVNAEDNLWTVKQLFDESGFHHLIAVENDIVVGIVSDRDLLKAISHRIDTPAESTKDTDTLNKSVKHIMTKNVISLRSRVDVYEAIDIFNQHKISCIPIVNRDNQALGIVSWRDILRVVAKTRRKPTK